jgi:hypothetical protein
MKKIIIGLVLIASLVFIYDRLTAKSFIADQVYGTSHCGSDCYSVITKSSDEIPSSLAEVNQANEDSRSDTSFTVVYEQNKWFGTGKKLLKLLKFQRAFTEEDHAKNTDTEYAKLVEESFEPVDSKHGVFSRVYEIHHKHDFTIELLPESLITPKLSNPLATKEWIAVHNPAFLKLKPLTVVSNEILFQWKQEKYLPQLEYHYDSPEGLTFENISREVKYES